MSNRSPMFPDKSFDTATDHLLDSQISSSGGVSLSIILAEPILFVQGFNATEYTERPPVILRGSLVVTVSKATKIKSITLTFKGLARTDWPEGIPPKKVETFEANDIHSHIWPFFNVNFPMAEYSSGAHLVRFWSGSGSSAHHSAGLDANFNGGGSGDGQSPNGALKAMTGVPTDGSPSALSALSSINTGGGGSLAATVSSSSSIRSGRARSSSLDSTRAIKGLANRIRRAASPSPGAMNALGSSSSNSNGHQTLAVSGLSLGPHRSFSKKEAHDNDTQSKGYRTFEPGEYIYNFELPIPHSTPESIECNFGSVKYTLEATVARSGTFKSNISGTKEVVIVRTGSDNNLEASEPIAISRDWEDQLHYDIVIGGKLFPIGTSIPIAFKFTPLAKVRCHRVRIYITEHCEYYCKNRKVHRIEPTRKYLLKEELPQEGITGSILGEYLGTEITSATELEYVVEIPQKFSQRRDNLHANTAYENIKVHHWIKLVLRLSKAQGSETEETKADGKPKRKYFEISIDSPISLLDNHCTNTNLSLPAYNAGRRPSLVRGTSSSMFPLSLANLPPGAMESPELLRPIHLLRKPSVAPPPFDADRSPPRLDEEPPTYETAVVAGPPETIRVPITPDDNGSSSTVYLRPNLGSTISDRSSADETSSVSGESTLQSIDQRSQRSRESAAIDDDDPISSVPVSELSLSGEGTRNVSGSGEEEDDEESEDQLAAMLPRSNNRLRRATSEMSASGRSAREPSIDMVDLQLIQTNESSSSEFNPLDTVDSYAGRYPLLKEVPSDQTSLTDATEGDLALTNPNDFDDSVSLKSTPSLWII